MKINQNIVTDSNGVTKKTTNRPKSSKDSYANYEEDKFASGGYYSAKLLKPSRFPKVLAIWCYGIFAILIISLFLPWTQNIRSYGRVTTFLPEQRPQTIHSTIAGRIEKWMVKEGQFVRKGDTIIKISEVKEKFFDPQLLVRLKDQLNAKQRSVKSTQEKAAALTRQIAALREGMKVSLSKAKNKLHQAQLKVQTDSADYEAIKIEYETAKVQLERQEKLYEQGLKSLTELESRKLKLQEVKTKLISYQNKLNITKNELLNARIEINSIEAEYLDKTAKAESELSATLSYVYSAEGEISKMENEYSNSEIRNSFYQVLAPQDGYIVKALVAGIGETIKEGEAVASILPADYELAVELFVDPIDIPLLEKGRKVRLQFDGWPSLVFSGWPDLSVGTFGGEVAVIDNTDTHGKYRILVVPDERSEKWPEQIRIGSGAYGWAMLNDVPIWYELWRQMNRFPADYMGSTKDGKVDKSEKENKKKEQQ